MLSEPYNIKLLEWNIRTIKVDGEPWFAINDVCRALCLKIRGNGSPNIAAVKRFLNADEQLSILADTKQGLRAFLCVSKSGLCKLIMRSNKEEAKELQNFVISLIPQNAIKALVTL